MLRETITKALKEAAQINGYGFYAGFDYRINDEHIIFPAAWTIPIQITKIEGRKEGYVTYKVTTHLMQTERKITEEKKEILWAKMEKDAIKIIDCIRPKSTIFNIENITMEPAEFKLSKNGEISLKTTFDVKIYFCLNE